MKDKVRIIKKSQSPYGAQSLATNAEHGAVPNPDRQVAIPLRGSIPCNGFASARLGTGSMTPSQSHYGAQSLATIGGGA